MSNIKVISLVLLGLVLAIGFNIWLDAGCALNGAMSAHGKVCV